MSWPKAKLEAALRICAACMYCDALCPVFPALAEKRDYAPGDLHYLAHLCHNCGTCAEVCQYSPPHVFAVDLPRAFASQRRRSYAEHVWPRGLAAAFRRPALGAVVFLAVALAAGLAVLAAGGAGAAGSFYAVAPWGLLAGLGGATLLGALASLAVSTLRFWRTIAPVVDKSAQACRPRESGDPGAGRRALPLDPRFRGDDNAGRLLRALPVALRDAVTLRHLGGELGCSRGRRPLHHLMAAGLSLDFVATLSAAALQHVWRLEPPYPWLSLPVLAGAAGGVAAVVGAVGLLALEIRRDGERGETALNVVLLAAIALVAASGLALLALRATPAMPLWLALHFGAVCGFFALLPVSKLLHAPFRAAALWRAAAEREGATPRRAGSRDG